MNIEKDIHIPVEYIYSSIHIVASVKNMGYTIRCLVSNLRATIYCLCNIKTLKYLILKNI